MSTASFDDDKNDENEEEHSIDGEDDLDEEQESIEEVDVDEVVGEDNDLTNEENKNEFGLKAFGID